jgi:outer membrane protein assembly factor BamB
VDGTEKAVRSPLGSPVTNDGPVWIGRNVDGAAADYFDGLLDEIRISKAARYDSGFTPPAEPFVADADTIALWHLDELGGFEILDSSGNDHDGMWSPWSLKSTQYAGIYVGNLARPALADLDDDGDLDLFVGASDGTTWFYENVGSRYAPSWDTGRQIKDQSGELILPGSNVSPCLKDIDNDGKLDLFIGYQKPSENSGRIARYQNTGTPSSPVWNLVTDHYLDISVQSSMLSPCFTDLERDEDDDLVIGRSDGTLMLFTNIGTLSSPYWALPNYPYGEIDVGAQSFPTFADLDNDGLEDLIVGSQNGPVYLIRNRGIPRVTISRGEPATPQDAVLLTLDGRGMEVAGYYISNSPVTPDPGAAGWVSLSPSTTFTASDINHTLEPGEGLKKVYVWFKDGEGEVYNVAYDTIVLDHAYTIRPALDAAQACDLGQPHTDQLPDAGTARYYAYSPGNWETLILRFDSEAVGESYKVSLYHYEETLDVYLLAGVYIGSILNERIDLEEIPAKFVVKVEWIGDSVPSGTFALEMATGATTTAGEIVWTYSTGSAIQSSPALSGGRLYFGNNAGTIYCLNIQTGGKIWSYKTGGPVQSSPAISAGNVYAGSQDGNLYCLDGQTGAWLWQYKAGGNISSSPAVSDGKVYVGCADGRVHCVDAATGQKVWESFPFSDIGLSSPAIGEGRVYIGGWGNNVYCLDAETGDYLWEYETNGYVHCSPAISGGKVYVGSSDGKVHAFDAQTGGVVWQYLTSSGLGSSSASVSEGRVFIGGGNGNNILCLDAETGDLLWEFQGSGYATASPAISQGKVFVAGNDWMYALDGHTGFKLWEYQAGGYIQASPSLSDGFVYFGSDDGKIQCIDAGDPEAGGWAMYRGDLVHSGDADLPAAVDSLSIEAPPIAFLSEPAGTYQVKAFLQDTRLGLTDVTSSVDSWSISDSGIATIDASGVITPVGEGRSTIRADYTLDSKTYVAHKRLTIMPPGEAVAGGTEFVSAVSVPFNTLTHDHVPDASTARYYTFVPGDWKKLMLRFYADTATSDYRITLYDGGQSQLFTYESYDGYNLNELISFSTIPSQAVLKVESLGDYETSSGFSLKIDTAATSSAGLKLWHYETGGIILSSPAVSGNHIYVGSDDGYVYCFDAGTGAKVWAYKTGGAVRSSPAISGGKVYLGSGDGIVYCLDSITGDCLWQFPTAAVVFNSSPTVKDGRVYVGGDFYNTKLYCLDATTGTKLWEYATSAYIPSSPAMIGGRIYFGSNDGKGYCLDAITGAKVWESPTGISFGASPAVSGLKVYVGGYYKVYCLSSATGAKLWEYGTGGIVSSSPEVSENRVYVGASDNKIYCLNAEDGTRVWDYQTGAGVSASPAISNGKVFIGSQDGKIYCLDGETGAKVWEYQTGAGIYSSPAVVGGKIYFGSEDKKVYCLNAGDPEAGGWPMLSHDLQHTGDVAHNKTEFLYGLIQAAEITEFTEYELHLTEVYDDNDFPVASGVQFSASDPSVASLSGNIVTALRNGRIVVSTDYGGKHYEQPLFLMVSPDNWEGWDNDTKAMADILPEEEFWQGDMVAGAGTDVDYYKFSISQNSLVEIGYLAQGGISDTSIELLDSSDQILASTISYNGLNKILTAGLPAGTYYLKLTPAGEVDHNSAYFIAYTIVGPLPPKGDIPIGVGEMKEGTVNSRTDATYFDFSLSQTTSLDISFLPTSLEADYHVELVDSNGTPITQIDFGNGWPAAIAVGLRPGSYSLKVTSSGDMDPVNPFFVELLTAPESYEVEANGTVQDALEVQQGVEVKGVLDENDIDFYAFNLDAPRYIRIDFTAETYGAQYNLTLYKNDEQNPIDNTVCPYGGSVFMEMGLTAGTYYLKVEGLERLEPHPAYRILLSESSNTQLEIESNNTILFANALDASHPKRGRIYSASDVDYYGFYVPAEVVVNLAFSSESTTADYKISITNGAETTVYQKTSTNGAAVTLTRKLPAGNFYVKVEPGTDIDSQKFYDLSTTTASLTGLKSLAAIALSASTDQVSLGGTLQIDAVGNYTDATQAPVTGVSWSCSDETIGSVSETGLVTGIANGFVTIYATLEGQMGQITLTVGAGEKPVYQTWGNLILVAGGGVAVTNTLRESTQYLCDMVYARFLVRGFEKEDIFYLNPVPWHDIDGDGYGDPVVSDETPTVADLRSAIETWASEQESTGPLYLVLVNHGGIDTFEIFPGEIITASQIHESLSVFQNLTGRDAVVMMEACKSGSFVDDLAPAGSDRMVLTCTDEGNAYLELKGRISFTQFLMDRLFSGDTFRQSYLKTITKLSTCGRPYSLMAPQLAEGKPFVLSLERLGGNFAIAGIFPEILSQTEDMGVTAGASVPFSVTVSDLSGKTKVWAVVEPPNYVPPDVVGDLEAPEVSLPTFDLTDEVNGVLDGIFVGSYGDFVYNGEHRIVFYARNADGLVTASPATIVTVSGGQDVQVVPGDVNGDGFVTLSDAIIGLRGLTGQGPAWVNKKADVNGDGRIGMAEVFYILQKAAGLR